MWAGWRSLALGPAVTLRGCNQQSLRREDLGGESVRRDLVNGPRRRGVSSGKSDRLVETGAVAEQQVAEFVRHREALHRQSELGSDDDPPGLVVDGDEGAPQLVQGSEQERDVAFGDRADDVEAGAGAVARLLQHGCGHADGAQCLPTSGHRTSSIAGIARSATLRRGPSRRARRRREPPCGRIQAASRPGRGPLR